jgi:hypothetical protein
VCSAVSSAAFRRSQVGQWCSARERLAFGGQLSSADREAYANDPGVLLSTGAGANRTKGDKGPEAS